MSQHRTAQGFHLTFHSVGPFFFFFLTFFPPSFWVEDPEDPLFAPPTRFALLCLLLVLGFQEKRGNLSMYRMEVGASNEIVSSYDADCASVTDLLNVFCAWTGRAPADPL